MTGLAPSRSRARRRSRGWILGLVSIAISIVVFVVPFAFILLTAAKGRAEASRLDFTWPTEWQLWRNIADVVQAREYMLVTAFINSTVLTVASVTILVILAAMVGYVLQRRPSRWTPLINVLVLAGLIIPPAVVPTIWVLQGLELYRTLTGLILIEVAFGFSFSILLFRAFMATIPREIDEAAVIDGAGPIALFFRVVFPLLRSVIVTVIVVQSVAIFNDFQNPLYFLPGDDNATVQLTLYNFKSQFTTQWNLLFADILLITIPPLIMYIFFNRQIVAGLTSGAVKG
jgi:raffinose/stachyose/melibiose transport system permease protein